MGLWSDFWEWVYLPVSPPFPISYFSIFFPYWFRLKHLGQEARIYADVPIPPSAKPKYFRKELHRKHNGMFYFKKGFGAGGVSADDNPFIEEHESYAENAEARAGYEQYMRSLEAIGLQAYVRREHSGFEFKGKQAPALDAVQSLLHKANRELGAEEQVRVPASASELHDMAAWERLVLLRENAPIRERWFNNLRHRARCPTRFHGSPDLDACPSHPAPDGHLYPAIRPKTFWLLTRSLELDWSLPFFLGFVAALFTYFLSLYTQINALVQLCSGPYLCPLGRTVSYNPVPGPPVRFRQASGLPYYYTTRSSYYPQKQRACSLPDNDCHDPGYVVQWPYIQTDAASSDTNFPPALRDRCRLEPGGEGGYVWDPFEARVRSEYWDCDHLCEEGECKVGFRAEAGDGGEAWMHFELEWYKVNREATVRCLDKLVAQGDLPSKESVGSGGLGRSVVRLVEGCVSASLAYSRLTTRCQCREGRTDWPIALYHYQAPARTCKNSKPFLTGQLCLADDECSTKGDGECTAAFEETAAVNSTREWGCFFSSPTAHQPILADYSTCGASVEAQIVRSTRSEPLLSKQQIAVEVDVTKKTVLITVFLVKEGAIVSAVLACLAAALFLLLLALPFLLLLAALAKLYTLLGTPPARRAKVKLVNDMVYYTNEAVAFGVHVLFSLLLNCSTTFRIVRMGRALWAAKMNASLEDLNRKLTSMVNILLNLIILYLSDSLVYEQTVLLVSIGLSLLLVCFQMQMEKEKLAAIAAALKDLNENRLSKFEVALLMHKIMEDFLDHDVNFLWVSHLVSSEPLLLPELRQHQQHKGGALLRPHNANPHEQAGYTEAVFERSLCGGFSGMLGVTERGATDKDGATLEDLYPSLPKGLVALMGHDARFEHADPALADSKASQAAVGRALDGAAAARAVLQAARLLPPDPRPPPAPSPSRPPALPSAEGAPAKAEEAREEGGEWEGGAGAGRRKELVGPGGLELTLPPPSASLTLHPPSASLTLHPPSASLTLHPPSASLALASHAPPPPHVPPPALVGQSTLAPAPASPARASAPSTRSLPLAPAGPAGAAGGEGGAGAGGGGSPLNPAFPPPNPAPFLAQQAPPPPQPPFREEGGSGEGLALLALEVHPPRLPSPHSPRSARAWPAAAGGSLRGDDAGSASPLWGGGQAGGGGARSGAWAGLAPDHDPLPPSLPSSAPTSEDAAAGPVMLPPLPPSLRGGGGGGGEVQAPLVSLPEGPWLSLV